MTKRLVVIDGKSVFYRGFYAMPGLSLTDGTPTGGVYGFASLALEIIKNLEPDYVAVAWDKKGTSIRKRLEILPTYKAGRKTPPDDFFTQIPLLHDLLDACGWPLYELDDYEADDIMGAFAVQAEKQGIETCLITSDLDMLQLVSPLTHVYALKKGFTNIERFDVEYFEEKYGINVHQFLDLKALKGDSSDNIPGVPGIGEKTGVQLLQEYGTLDVIYQNIDAIKPTIAKKLTLGKDLAYMSKEVAKLWCDAPLTLDLVATDARSLDVDRLSDTLKRLEFTSLLRRLPKHMQVKEKDDNQASLFSSSQPEEVHDTAKVIDWKSIQLVDPESPILVHMTDDSLWVSLDAKTVSVVPWADVEATVGKIIRESTVVAYDTKALYHAGAKHGIQLEAQSVHDIAQAAFLINSLQRDRSISGLVGYLVEETDPGQVATALWRAYDEQKKDFLRLPNIAKVAHELDFPLVSILFRMEQSGIKIDTEQLAHMSKELGDRHQQLEQEMYTIAGREFNIGSPAQLSEVLFTDLGLPTKGIKKGKTAYSTGQKELDKLRGVHPIIEMIEQTRELSKLKNTYIDALPLLVDSNQRLHTTFNQDVASTGRLSSTQPNLQNIPVRTELGRKIREAFVPEPGNVFVSADYSQFELRLAAVLAGDEALIQDFNEGVDIHTKTASQVYEIPMDEVTKDQRRAAKVINFGVLYGMSPHGLSVAANMSFGEAKMFIDHYFALRAPIRQYIDKLLADAATNGYVETLFGRRRPTPDVNSSNFMVREGAKRAAANMPIQGTEADLMKMAMIEVDKRLGDLGDQALQIHDSILIECPAENAEKVQELLRDCMENIYPSLGVVLSVDVTVGKHWGEL